MKELYRYPMLIVLVFFLAIGGSFIRALSFSGEKTRESQASDVEVVSNPKTPVPEKGKRQRLVFSEELTIGVSEGDENYMFGESVQVTMDDQGCFYVLDWNQKRIQKFDPEGVFLLSIGGRGQGPGEFGNIWSPNFDKDGNLYATDIVNKRITFFSKGGTYLKDITLPVDIGGITILPNGNYFTSKTKSSEDTDASIYDHIHGIYDLEFRLLTEIHREKQVLPHPGNRSRAELIAGIVSAGAFKPTLINFVTEDGLIYAGFAANYEIRLFSQEGMFEKAICREYDPIKVSPEHKEDYLNQNLTGLLRVSNPKGSEASLFDEVRKFMEYPKYIPAFKSFSLMENGWLYIVVDSIENEYVLIDLFDEQGIYIGQFNSNIPVSYLNFKNGKAYGVATVDDFKYVKRYSYELRNY